MLQYQKPTIFPREILAVYTEINAGVFPELPNGLDFKISNHEIFQASLNIISAQLALNKTYIVTANQVHQDNVLLINEVLEDFAKLECDAIVTQNPEIIPSVRSADCGNILLFDPVTKTRAVIHSGYKGTTLNIVGKTVDFMRDLGVDPSQILAFIGPSIGQNALWVWQSNGRNCPEEFKVELDEILRYAVADTGGVQDGNDLVRYLYLAQPEIQNFPENEKPGFLIDLNGWIRFQLIEAGIKPENIEVCKINTFEDARFHSQRRARIKHNIPDFGIGLGFIALKTDLRN
jgi:YfiH family protein